MKAIICLAFLIACGGTQSEPKQPDPSQILTEEQCRQRGGLIRPDIGAGQVRCADDERQIGRVQFGIEGAICCVRTYSPYYNP